MLIGPVGTMAMEGTNKLLQRVANPVLGSRG